MVCVFHRGTEAVTSAAKQEQRKAIFVEEGGLFTQGKMKDGVCVNELF